MVIQKEHTFQVVSIVNVWDTTISMICWSVVLYLFLLYAHLALFVMLYGKHPYHSILNVCNSSCTTSDAGIITSGCFFLWDVVLDDLVSPSWYFELDLSLILVFFVFGTVSTDFFLSMNNGFQSSRRFNSNSLTTPPFLCMTGIFYALAWCILPKQENVLLSVNKQQHAVSVIKLGPSIHGHFICNINLTPLCTDMAHQCCHVFGGIIPSNSLQGKQTLIHDIHMQHTPIK